MQRNFVPSSQRTNKIHRFKQHVTSLDPRFELERAARGTMWAEKLEVVSLVAILQATVNHLTSNSIFSSGLWNENLISSSFGNKICFTFLYDEFYWPGTLKWIDFGEELENKIIPTKSILLVIPNGEFIYSNSHVESIDSYQLKPNNLAYFKDVVKELMKLVIPQNNDASKDIEMEHKYNIYSEQFELFLRGYTTINEKWVFHLLMKNIEPKSVTFSQPINSFLS